MPNFEEFERTDARWHGRRVPTATIQRRGLISFSPAGYELLGSPDAVTFLYDQGEQLIGFRKAARRESNAHALRSIGNGQHVVSAGTFCRFIGIDMTVSRRYPLAVVDGVPCVDLGEPGAPVTSNRKAAVTS